MKCVMGAPVSLAKSYIFNGSKAEYLQICQFNMNLFCFLKSRFEVNLCKDISLGLDTVLELGQDQLSCFRSSMRSWLLYPVIRQCACLT